MNMTLLVAALIRAICFRVHSDKYSLSLFLFLSPPLPPNICRHLSPHKSQLRILSEIVLIPNALPTFQRLMQLLGVSGSAKVLPTSMFKIFIFF